MGLAFSVSGLIVSLFVGWGFPIGSSGWSPASWRLVARWRVARTAIWAIGWAASSVLYSAGWLLWAASRANLFG